MARPFPIMDDLNPAYVKYIKSDAWKLRCQVYFMKHGRYCKACSTTKGPIHVHHMSYDRLGREPMSDLVSVCSACHRGIHSLHRKSGRRMSLRDATMLYIKNKHVPGH